MRAARELRIAVVVSGARLPTGQLLGDELVDLIHKMLITVLRHGPARLVPYVPDGIDRRTAGQVRQALDGGASAVPELLPRRLLSQARKGFGQNPGNVHL